MLEGNIPAIWTSLLSWFTPAVFFVLLNLVIGTIAVISKRKSSSATSAGDHHHGSTTNFARAPALVLDRLRSFNFSQYVHREIPTETGHIQSETAPVRGSGACAGDRGGNALKRVPSLVLKRLSLFGLSRFVSGEFQAETVEIEPAAEVALGSSSQVEEHDHYDEHHIARSQSDTQPSLPKLPVRMKKSASNKSVFSHFEETEIPKDHKIEEDGEVDAKADDFINKFRNQLRLQRLDSIIRYKDMLPRGTSN